MQAIYWFEDISKFQLVVYIGRIIAVALDNEAQLPLGLQLAGSRDSQDQLLIYVEVYLLR